MDEEVKKEEKQEKKETKKKGKKGLIIAIVIIAVILLAAIIYFVTQLFSGSQTTGTTWGDTYYAYLKAGLEQENDEERQKYGLQPGVEKAELQFVETSGTTEPVMLMSYDKDNKSYTNIYYINDQNAVSSVLNQEYSDAEYLYNIEKQEYNWYLHNDSENEESYTNVTSIINGTNQSKPEYVLNKNDKTEVQLDNGTKVELTEFDETFIRPDIQEDNKQEIDIVDYVSQDIIDKINSMVSSYDKESDKINEEVQNKVDQLEQVAQEAIKQDDVIKAGNFTLHYGKYIDKYGTVYTLNPDGTASCTSTELASRNLENGEFVVYNYKDYEEEIKTWERENGPIGFSGEWMIAIGENIDKEKPYLTYSYIIEENDAFYNAQTDEQWEYQGESDSSNENNTNNEKPAQTASTFKVGKYTLHYGTYSGVGTTVIEDKSGAMKSIKYDYSITLNQDGTYSIKSSNEEAAKSRSGKFTVGTTSGMTGIIFDDLNNDGVLEGNAMFLAVYDDDTISTAAGASADFTYQGY